jgi:transcriptional regulator with XRE-family HTH domain
VRVGQLLEGTGVAPSREEVRKLARATGQEVESLLSADLVAEGRTNVVEENLRYLFSTLAHGDSKRMAEEVGVHPTTISEWASGRQVPSNSHLHAISRYFGLSPFVDLRTVPLFLMLEPVGHHARREWVVKQVSEMRPEDLRDLYPALRRILETD